MGTFPRSSHNNRLHIPDEILHNFAGNGVSPAELNSCQQQMKQDQNSKESISGRVGLQNKIASETFPCVLIDFTYSGIINTVIGNSEPNNHGMYT